MTLEQMLLFKGKSNEFEQYSKLINQSNKLARKITKLSNQIMDEDDSMSVFTGELSDKERQQLSNHMAIKDGLLEKRRMAQKSLDDVEISILEYQK